MILVTGGAGFIGSRFVRDWQAATGEPVVNLGKLTCAGNRDNLADLQGNARHHFVQHDVADRAGHAQRYAMDTHKIRQQLGWKPA